MQLVYLDESGNSGNNLQETQQPIFVTIINRAKANELDTSLL